VTGEVLVDNQKCAVIAHRRGGEVVFHPRFLDLAGLYGFRPRACRPARAQTKGKDERNVGPAGAPDRAAAAGACRAAWCCPRRSTHSTPAVSEKASGLVRTARAFQAFA
jgi:hypothetical protein